MLSKNKSLSDKLDELNKERDKIRSEDTKKLLEVKKKIRTVQDLLKGEVDKCIRGARLVATTVSKIYADSVGIITPYAAQTRLINAILSEQVRKEDGIVCATVHQFQGSDRIALSDSRIH